MYRIIKKSIIIIKPIERKEMALKCTTRYSIGTMCLLRFLVNFRQRLALAEIIYNNELKLPKTKTCDSNEPCRGKCESCDDIRNGAKLRPRQKLGLLERLMMFATLVVDAFSVGDGIKWARNPVSRHNLMSWPGTKMPCIQVLRQEEQSRRDLLDFYIISTIAILVVSNAAFTYFCGPDDYWAYGSVLSYLALFGAQQILEMIASTARMVLVDVYDKGQKPTSSNRVVLLLLFGYIKMIFGFSLIYMWFASKGDFAVTGLNPLELSISIQLSLDMHLENVNGLFLESVIALQGLLSFAMIALFLARLLSIPAGVWDDKASQ